MKYGNWIVESDRFAMQTGVLGKVFLQPHIRMKPLQFVNDVEALLVETPRDLRIK